MLYIMNTSIIPPEFEGKMIVTNLSTEEAGGIARNANELTSAVGHESSAQVLTALLKMEIAFNRIPIRVQDGDMILAFQLKQRLPEGAVPSAEELLTLDYQFRLIMFG
jgi:hypothetical protein